VIFFCCQVPPLRDRRILLVNVIGDPLLLSIFWGRHFLRFLFFHLRDERHQSVHKVPTINVFVKEQFSITLVHSWLFLRFKLRVGNWVDLSNLISVSVAAVMDLLHFG
jgi:hypothetical protein